MDPVLPPAPSALVPLPPPRQRTTLGSLAVAMLAGAVLTIGLLYIWGAQIAKEEAAAQEME